MAADRQRLPGLVRQLAAGQIEIEIARIGGKILSLDARPTLDLQDIRHMRHLQEVFLIVKRSRAATAIEIGDEGWTADRREGHPAFAHDEPLGRIAAAHCCRRWRLADEVQQSLAIEEYPLGHMIDREAGACEKLACLLVHDAHADVFQHRHRGVVNSFDLLFRQNRDGGVGIAEFEPVLGKHKSGVAYPAHPGRRSHTRLFEVRLRRELRSFARPGQLKSLHPGLSRFRPDSKRIRYSPFRPSWSVCGQLIL